jgi:FkbM family methyltransferase
MDMKIAVDLGAYQGKWSWEHRDDFDLIFAVEPCPKFFGDLCDTAARVEHDLCRGTIIPCPFAVANRKGTASLYVNERKDATSLVKILQKEQLKYPVCAEEQVSVLTMEDFVNGYQITHINHLQIDVEGTEEEVLRGLGKIRPKIITCAHYHSILFEGVAISEKLEEIMLGLGYEKVGMNYHDLIMKLKE